MKSPLKIAEGVYQLQAVGARVTVIETEDGVVMVDAGSRGSLRRVSSGLDAIGRSMDDLRLVAITHGHPDHVGGLDKIVEASSARVAAHRDDAGVIDGTGPMVSPYRSGFLANVTRPFITPFYGAPVVVDYLVEDGDTLPAVPEMRVVHVPGHTAGSMCIYLPSRKLIMVGDAMQNRFNRLTGPAAAVTKDLPQAMESLKKLLLLDIDVICFGHHAPITHDASEALRQAFDGRAASSRRC